MVHTPVLFITFARPEYARQSFDAIKKAKPKRLYFYSNKARSEKSDEIVRNNEIRNYINEINWECDLKTFFRQEYVDIYTSLRGAIDWIFNNEEEAIILEEDCVASLAFFDYCDQLLPKYKNEQKVWMLSGNNFTPKGNPQGLSFFFSRYMHIYGWASWADRWHKQDKKMQEFKNLKFYTIKKYYNSIIKAFVAYEYWNKVYKNYNKYNPWDHVFTYNMVKFEAYSVVPSINLVIDIGEIGVHHQITKEKKINKIIFNDTSFSLINYPQIIKPLYYDDYHFFNHILKPLIKRKCQKILNKIL